MLHILLVCGTGASSGFMAKNIRKAAKEENLEINVKARSDSEIEEYIESIDLLLVGPHLRYMLNDLLQIAAPYHLSLIHIFKLELHLTAENFCPANFSD